MALGFQFPHGVLLNHREGCTSISSLVPTPYQITNTLAYKTIANSWSRCSAPEVPFVIFTGVTHPA